MWGQNGWLSYTLHTCNMHFTALEVTAETEMSIKQRLDATDPSDIPSFLAKEMDYGFQDSKKKKKSVDIFLFPQVALMVKKPPASAGGQEMRVRSGGPPGGGNGNPHQHSCLRIPLTEEPGGLQSRGVTKSWTRLK